MTLTNRIQRLENIAPLVRLRKACAAAGLDPVRVLEHVAGQIERGEFAFSFDEMAIRYIQAGDVTFAALAAELGADMARVLFSKAGVEYEQP